VTGPNPDAELDHLLGLDDLPPARVLPEHMATAHRVLELWEQLRPLGYDLAALAGFIAQVEADAEQRAVARYIAEHHAAGT
jgi:hypothetical protein